jgi:hypothetical protein
MTDKELMKAALEALTYVGDAKEIYSDTIETLRDRLSAPEPEPLEYWNAVEGWVKLDEVRQHFDSVSCGTIYKNPGEGRSPLYTASPQREWVWLNGEDIKEIESWVEFKEAGGDEPIPLGKLVVYIGDKLRRKNNG